ncbi:hypothetical protein [Streptomyces sp. NPDC005336]|uniref:hypothetical protein n=1 Tax=Streptomyces sp. NPDC005336 TaxID=3157035 RepID=UPI0033A330D5
MLGATNLPEAEQLQAHPMRSRLYHLPARLAVHSRRRWLRIERTWPWADMFVLAWKRLIQLPATI